MILFLMAAISVLAYQKEANENKTVPNQTVVISAILRSGQGIPVIIPKGLLNPENEGKKWLTYENFKKQIEKNKPKVDNRHTFEANK